MIITVKVSDSELAEMDLSADSLEETIYNRLDNDDYDGLEGYDVVIDVQD